MSHRGGAPHTPCVELEHTACVCAMSEVDCALHRVGGLPAECYLVGLPMLAMTPRGRFPGFQRNNCLLVCSDIHWACALSRSVCVGVLGLPRFVHVPIQRMWAGWDYFVLTSGGACVCWWNAGWVSDLPPGSIPHANSMLV